MKKGVVLVTFLILIFLGSFTFFAYEGLFGEITGRQILADNSFEQPAGAFKPSRPTINNPSLSPGLCEIQSISIDKEFAEIGKNVSIYIDGIGCISETKKISLVENDLFFDDVIKELSGNFSRSRLILDVEIDEDFTYLFNEFFEGDKLELYFETDSIKSDILEVYLGDVGLSPLGETRNSLTLVLFWLVFGIVLLGVLIISVSLIRMVRVNSRYKN